MEMKDISILLQLIYSQKAHFLDNNNRRGLGFDKPEPIKGGPTCREASLSSFGHTGFTGTIAWADPETELLYIFLSNRIHPDVLK